MMAPERFKLHTKVAVKVGPPEPHCRTPVYLRGKVGTLEKVVGYYPNPSLLAYYKPGLPKLCLFRVKFEQQSLWPEYGASSDSLYADLYENWLNPIEGGDRSNPGEEGDYG